MRKRLSDTDIWEEDWFVELPQELQLFTRYLFDKADHAGIWKPNFKKFNFICKTNISADKVLQVLNADKQRIEVLANGRWFIKNFLKFHYHNELKLQVKMHLSAYNILRENGIEPEKLNGLVIEDKRSRKELDRSSPNPDFILKNLELGENHFTARVDSPYIAPEEVFSEVDTLFIKNWHKPPGNLSIRMAAENLMKEFGKDKLDQAMKEAALRETYSIPYVRKVLMNQHQEESIKKEKEYKKQKENETRQIKPEDIWKPEKDEDWKKLKE